MLLAACGVKESYNASEAEVQAFHQQLSAGQHEKIWLQAAPEFRKGTDKAKFIALMEAIERKLGKVVETERTNWSANNTNGVSTVTMTYKTAFEHGSGTEKLVYLWVTDERLALLNYSINSTDMMVN
jgi:hypothetical protein